MKGKWIFYEKDFEFCHAIKYMLGREERGNKIPAFYKIPRPNVSLRFYKDVVLNNDEKIYLKADGDYVLYIDFVRQSIENGIVIPKGAHKLKIEIGNAFGMCALKIDGDSVYTDESFLVEAYDNNFVNACTSPLLENYEGLPSEFEFNEVEVFSASDKTVSGERIIDFGKESFLSIELYDVKSEIKLYYGESYNELFSDRIVIKDSVKPCSFIKLPCRALRYLRVTGDTSFTYKAKYPKTVDKDSSCFSGDKELSEIYDVAKYTLELTKRFFFLDGIKRDRWPWAGDAYITAKMNEYSFHDLNVVKRTLIALRGESEAVAPVNNILEYSFYWYLMLWDYYLSSGDLSFIKSTYFDAVKLLDYYLKRVDEKGFIPPIDNVWLFIDWHDIDRKGAVCVVQMLFYKAIEITCKMAELLGKTEDAKRYGKIQKELFNNINKYFWLEDKGGYISVYRENNPSTEIRRHQNYFGVLFGFANEKRKRKIIDNVILNDSVPKITTPFFKFFEYETLCEIGETERAFKEIKSYFGAMLKLGATTIWEEYDEKVTGEEVYAMYGEPYDKSLCHAWGAGALYFIGKYLMGVKNTSVSYDTFTVEPYLSLGDFSGVVPITGGNVSVKLSNGEIKVFSTKKGGTLKVKGNSYTLPENKEIIVKI